MEKSNGLKRSEIWNNIYEVLARLDLKKNEGDCLDRPSAATEIEQLFLKLLPIHDVGNCKRFERQDLLRAYQAGHIENLDECFTPTSMEDLKELLEDAEKWYKRYTE